jgi:two-component system phosphate regulon sensor histidine kinase PhoR
MIAHDIRSSLTIIGGFVLRLREKRRDIGEAKQERYLDIIKNESGKLEDLVDDFLEFSRLQTGRLKLDFSPTSLHKKLMELVDAYQLRALQSGVELELQNEKALPIIEADSRQIGRVFTNLLDNALKFSKEEGKIFISTQETDREIIIRFMDQGTGIHPVDLPYIFDPFHRGQIGGKMEGFGLGLAAVKTIVQAHGGQVHVESELGKGSLFTLTLPKAQKPKDRIGDI